MVMYGHGGNVYSAAKAAGCHVDEIIDLSSNVSPFTPDSLLKGINIKSTIARLPEPYSLSLVSEIAKYHDVSEESIVVGSGSSEFIQKICALNTKKRAMIVQPTYIDYMKQAELAEMHVCGCIMCGKKNFAFDENEILQCLPETAVCFICNPNNPTGTLIPKDEILFLADMFKKTLFVVDESYIDFCTDNNHTLIGCQQSNIVVLRSFSKAYAVAGLRAGYVYTQNRHLTAELKKAVSPWSLNSLAQEVCKRALNEDMRPYFDKIQNIKKQTIKRLSENKNLEVIIGHANYILIKLKKSDAASFCEYMLNHKILVRNCSNFVGLSDKYIRIAVREQIHMDTFCRLAEVYFRIY